MELDKQPKGTDNKQEEPNLIWTVIKYLAEEQSEVTYQQHW